MCQSTCNTSQKLKETIALLKQRNRVLRFTQISLISATVLNLILLVKLISIGE